MLAAEGEAESMSPIALPDCVIVMTPARDGGVADLPVSVASPVVSGA